MLLLWQRRSCLGHHRETRRRRPPPPPSQNRGGEEAQANVARRTQRNPRSTRHPPLKQHTQHLLLLLLQVQG